MLRLLDRRVRYNSICVGDQSQILVLNIYLFKIFSSTQKTIMKNSTNKDNTMSTLRDAKAYSTHRRLTYDNNKTANITSTECYTECKKSDKSVFLINVLNLATELQSSKVM